MADNILAAAQPLATVTIVIPAFDCREQVLATIASLVPLTATRYAIQIVVVDDASRDGTAEAIQHTFPAVKVISHPYNKGTASARNTGASTATTDYILFLDSDCRPSNHALLERHIETLRRGFEVSCGAVIADGTDFWSKYFMLAQTRRVQAFLTEKSPGITFANTMVSRQTFQSTGGFPEEYRKYGFEDIAFACRLKDLGVRTSYSPDACVVHTGQVNLQSIVRKMRQVGEHAELFSKQFPAMYKTLPYARLDWACTGLLRIGTKAVNQTLTRLLPRAEWFVEQQGVPFWLAAATVKIYSAFSYIRGRSYDAA